MENQPKNWTEEINSKIQDSCNQIYAYKFIDDVDEVKKQLSGADLKTLEAYTGETKGSIDSLWPNICDEYNALIEEFKQGQFDEKRMKEIFSEAWDVTHQG